MRRARWAAVSVAAVSILLLADVPGAQPPTAPTPPSPGPPPSEGRPAQPAPVPTPPTGPTAPVPSAPAKEEEREPPRVLDTAIEQPVPEVLLPSTPTAVSPRVFVGPDLFNPPAHQGWISLTPSFTLSGEYNDNVFFTARNKRSDEILGFTPGLTLSLQRPDYRVRAGYHTSGELYLQESGLSNFGKDQQFFADVFYQASRRVTFTLTDRFLMSPNSNSITSSGVSVGRRDAWTNTLTPRLRWQATPSTAFGLLTSYTVIRFRATGGTDSDTYRVGLLMDHRLTKRLIGTVNADVAYLDVRGEPTVWTYTPSLGFVYDVTPTLSAWARGGPSLVEQHGDIVLRPAAAAALVQTFKFGSLQVGYDRAVIGDTVGATDRQAIFASLFVPTLQRGLQFSVIPRYSIADTSISRTNVSSRSETVKTLTVTLYATYQIVRNISVIGSYTFFQQRVDRNRADRDIDQNRAFLGLQYAFPINFY